MVSVARAAARARHLVAGSSCGGTSTRGGDQAHAHMVHSPRAVPCSAPVVLGFPPSAARLRPRHARRRGGAADAASILALALATPALARARPRGGPSPGPVGHRDPTRRFHCWSSPRGTRQAHCWTRHASQRAHFWARALLHGRSIAGPAARARGGGWSGIRGRSSAMRDAAATRGAATAAARIQTVGAHRARSSQSF